MTYLPQFQACVEAGTYSIMCSYNRFVYVFCFLLKENGGAFYHLSISLIFLSSVNGVPACANKKLLTDILRTQWKFKGVENK